MQPSREPTLWIEFCIDKRWVDAIDAVIGWQSVRALQSWGTWIANGKHHYTQAQSKVQIPMEGDGTVTTEVNCWKVVLTKSTWSR